MRYALLTTAAAAALSLSIAQGLAQTSSPSSGGTATQSTQSGQSTGQTSQSNPTSKSGQTTQSGQTGQTGNASTSGNTGTAGKGTTGNTADTPKSGNTADTAKSGNAGTSSTTNAGGGTSTSTSSTGSVGAVNVTSEQRTQITRAFSSVNVQPVTNVNFEVRTGTVLPASVSLHPCPRQVIDILTGIRQCEFVIVKNEIVIVEPSSRKIVTVIERRG